MKKPKTNFKRLVSNLPYNPSLISQLSFYGKRLKQETSIRRLGFLFVALTFFIQLFAIIAPPQPSVASAGNDILPGGFGTKDQGVAACRANTANFGAILRGLGVSCDNLANGSARKIDYGEYGGQLYSIGYRPYGFALEQPVDIPSAGARVWARPLTAWGPHCYNDGRGCMAIVGTRNDGSLFMVLYSCGNLVTIGVPRPLPPPPPPPPPAPVKQINCSLLNMSVANGAHVPLGSTVSVQGQASGSKLPSGEKVDMYYTGSNVDTKAALPAQKALGVPFVGAQAYDTTPRNFTLTQPGHYTFILTVKYDGSTKTAGGSGTGNCVKDVYVDKDTCKNPTDKEACVIQNKRASNVTQKIPDTNGKIVQPGDVIEYTLSATNTFQSNTIQDYVIQEQIGDILEYADIVDLNGGKKADNNIVSWPAKDIKANQTISVKFTVKVKNPIPQTPTSASDPGSYDLVMTNVYGETVKIPLPGSVPKVVEQTTASLPNTGPGENAVIGFIIFAVVGYFFARSRLLDKEVELVHDDYVAGA